MSKRKTFVEEYLEEHGRSEAYILKKLILAVNREIRRQMREQQMTQKELGERLGVKQPRVSSLLSCKKNLTLESMARLAHALDCEWETPSLRHHAEGKPRGTRAKSAPPKVQVNANGSRRRPAHAKRA